MAADEVNVDHAVAMAFVRRVSPPDEPSVQVEGDALMVDSWWPAALWLGPSTCLVRRDECPRPTLPIALEAALGEVGLAEVDVGLDAPIEAISVGRLGVLGADWQVWSSDVEVAGAAIATAVSG